MNQKTLQLQQQQNLPVALLYMGLLSPLLSLPSLAVFKDGHDSEGGGSRRGGNIRRGSWDKGGEIGAVEVGRYREHRVWS